MQARLYQGLQTPWRTARPGPARAEALASHLTTACRAKVGGPRWAQAPSCCYNLHRRTMALRFMHISDLHLLDLRGVRPWDYFNKRITGRLNLAFKRKYQHDEAIFDAMIAVAHRLGVERVVVTGDLTNLSLPSEFAHVQRRLRSVGLPVTVIPGNHDAYVADAVTDDLFDRYLGEFMEGERVGGPFPYAQCHDDVVLFGLSTAEPSWPLWATGRVGPRQLARLRDLLHRFSDKCRVVLIHHPPVKDVARPRHELLDLEAFGQVIAEAGAELILHGHEHRQVVASLPGPRGEVPVHGIASGTARSQRPGRQASCAIYNASSLGIDRELYQWNGTDFAVASAQHG